MSAATQNCQDQKKRRDEQLLQSKPNPSISKAILTDSGPGRKMEKSTQDTR